MSLMSSSVVPAHYRAFWLLSILALTACGGGKDDPAPGTSPLAASGTYSAPVEPAAGRSASAVAKAARGSLSCPSTAKAHARAEGQPINDLVGVSPGMSYDEAAQAVLCTDELLIVAPDERRGFRLNARTADQAPRQGYIVKPAQADVPQTQEQYMQRLREESRQRNNFVRTRDVPPGHSKWLVGTMGLRGEEKVINVAREQWFDTQRLPPADAVERALVEKYGQPSKRQEYGGVTLLWAFDTLGRPITETSRLHAHCGLDHRIDGILSLKPDCGVTIAAKLNPPRDNERLVEFLEVHIVDQAKASAALEQTERGLLAIDEGRKARELEKANQQQDEVKL